MVRDWRQLHGADLIVLLFGVLALLLSFVTFSGADGSDNGIDYTAAPNNAWHGTALIGVILVLVATAIAVVEILRIVALPSIGVPVSLVVAALSVVGALLIIIRTFTLPDSPVDTADEGVHFGGVLLIIVCAAQAAGAVVRMLRGGERMPWDHPGGESAWAPPVPPAPGVPPAGGPVPPVTGTTPPPPPPPGASGNA